MSLFYRRFIQQMLNHCSTFLSREQLEVFVEQLNQENKKSLETQWELAVLYTLSSSGIIEHETDYKKRPDVRWIARDLSCEFIADVRTVSDEGYEKENPREFYREELVRQVEKFGGLDPSFFRDEPSHKMEGEIFSNRRVKLLYPPVNEYKRLFNRDFLNFLKKIKDNKPEHDSIRLTGEDFDVTIAYWKQKGSTRIGGGNISYTTPYSLERNPIYRALEKKYDQLKKADYQGIKGIILTDGNCHALSTRFKGYTGETYTDEQIIWGFLKDTKSISFIVTIFAKREQVALVPFSRPFSEPLQIKAKLFENANADFPLQASCRRALLEIPVYFPETKLDAYNAARHLRKGWDSLEKGWYEGTRIETSNTMNKIFFSSRSLAELLAQRITPEKFCQINNLNTPKGNFFDLWLKQGMGISSISFDKNPDGDDDTVVITYEPDFAMKKFEVPKQGIRHFLLKLWQKSKYFPKGKLKKAG